MKEGKKEYSIQTIHIRQAFYRIGCGHSDANAHANDAGCWNWVLNLCMQDKGK
jgi:hypothetical protein